MFLPSLRTPLSLLCSAWAGPMQVGSPTFTSPRRALPPSQPPTLATAAAAATNTAACTAAAAVAAAGAAASAASACQLTLRCKVALRSASAPVPGGQPSSNRAASQQGMGSVLHGARGPCVPGTPMPRRCAVSADASALGSPPSSSRHAALLGCVHQASPGVKSCGEPALTCSAALQAVANIYQLRSCTKAGYHPMVRQLLQSAAVFSMNSFPKNIPLFPFFSFSCLQSNGVPSH